MSDEESKIKHSKRLHKEKSAIVKQTKIAKSNGSPITEGSDITLNGMTYPYAWLEGTSPSVRASVGIEKNGDINYDTKYYWGIWRQEKTTG